MPHPRHGPWASVGAGPTHLPGSKLTSQVPLPAPTFRPVEPRAPLSLPAGGQSALAGRRPGGRLLGGPRSWACGPASSRSADSSLSWARGSSRLVSGRRVCRACGTSSEERSSSGDPQSGTLGRQNRGALGLGHPSFQGSYSEEKPEASSTVATCSSKGNKSCHPDSSSAPPRGQSIQPHLRES